MSSRRLSTALPTTMRERSSSISLVALALMSSAGETAAASLPAFALGLLSSTCTMTSAR
ncbi:hypothetical protein D3C81_1278410 [compost metagenome]